MIKFAVLTKDVRLFEQIRECFQESRFCCDVFYDEVPLIRSLKKEFYDLILLDADIHYANGNPVFSWINCHSGHTTPVLLIGHFKDRDSMTEAFALGAADIVTRPLNSKELYARSMIAIQRLDKKQGSASQCVVERYTLDKESSSMHCGEEYIKLSAKEFAIAWLFFSNPGTYFSRKQIATMIWGSDANIIDRTLEQHIYKLRKKLHIGKESNVQLRTVYSLGYKLEIALAPHVSSNLDLIPHHDYFLPLPESGIVSNH